MANTRKFHGLLVASHHPPIERWLYVSNIYDVIINDDETIELSQKKGDFSFDLFPSITYNLSDIEVKKTFFMQHDHNTTVIKYDVKTDKLTKLIHYPIISSRHFYDTYYLHNPFQIEKEIIENGLIINPNNSDKSLKIMINDSSYLPDESWIQTFYEKDKQRNDSYLDYLLRIGRFENTIDNTKTFYVVLTVEDEPINNPEEIFSNEIQRKQQLISNSNLSNQFNKLILSTDNFIAKKAKRHTIIAGYHWFGDWGRDTLIALPGISLVTKRYQIAKDILQCLVEPMKNGLIPNTFDDRTNNPAYNTVDASLWFVDRVYQYMKYTNDIKFLKTIYPHIKSIIQHYHDGTKHHIHMDDDYLISHDPGLTWMDVKLGDFYPTPRSNKAVEIQALWYNALKITSLFSQILNKQDEYMFLSEKVKESFNDQYDQQYDVIDKKDTSCRPNKIFLVSLDFNLINKSLQKNIVNDVKENLVTIFGLRTLADFESEYKGSYYGDYNKDLAYHNGTIWPWPFGSFIKSYVKVNNHNSKSRKYAFTEFISPMLNVFGDKWDGSIFEIFDADSPYIPRGCITQAWSVAEILRAWVEDIENIKPEYEHIFSSNKIRV
jgi:predicted glycogen debranching enzyme